MAEHVLSFPNGSLAVFEIPYPRPPLKFALPPRRCAKCDEDAQFVCVEGHEHTPLCSAHAEPWARDRALALTIRPTAGAHG